MQPDVAMLINALRLHGMTLTFVLKLYFAKVLLTFGAVQSHSIVNLHVRILLNEQENSCSQFICCNTLFVICFCLPKCF